MQQEQYFKAVPVSEKPKEKGYFILTNDNGDSESSWYTPGFGWNSWFEGEPPSRFTHYLQPIVIPDAERLRGLLSEMCDKVEVMFEEKRDNPKDKDNAKTRAFNRLAFCLTRAKNYLQPLPSPPIK